MWADVLVRACASDSPPANVAAYFWPAPRALIATSSAFFDLLCESEVGLIRASRLSVDLRLRAST